jgi:exodeoxyribonuclease VII small subunit
MPRAKSKTEKSPPAELAASTELTASTEGLAFEEAIERLEGLVTQLEDGELDLETSLSAFEEGVSLSKHCAGQLEVAQRRIEVLTREGGEWLARPFEGADGEDDEESA